MISFLKALAMEFRCPQGLRESVVHHFELNDLAAPNVEAAAMAGVTLARTG
jgi:hypothetical protein